MMTFKEESFVPLLLGANLNSYSLAREFHEVYGIKSIVLGKYTVTQIIGSQILDFIKVPDMEDENTVVKKIIEIAEKYTHKKVILLGCSDTLLKVIMRNKGNFPSNVVAPYIDIEKAETLMNKEEFYKLAQEYNIPYPKTFVHTKDTHQGYTLPFQFPVVLKPADQPLFFAHKFPGQKKVYIINTKTELDVEIAKIYASGYSKSLTIQEFVPGDDSYMYVLNAYVDQKGKVTFMSFANILLEEHTPTARGNHAIILGSYNEEVCKQAKTFLEKVGYRGFANFDIKYDTRDGLYKFFEINLRQGNSHYHVTAAGYNMAKILVDDVIYHKERNLVLAKDKKLFLIVPKLIGLFYVSRPTVRKEMLKMIALGKTVNPLFYWKDMTFKRLFYLLLNNAGHFIKFFKYYKKVQ